MVKPRPAANADLSSDQIFEDGDFIAAGQLVIPPNELKPSTPSEDSIFVNFMMPSTSASCLISHVFPGLLHR